MTDKEILERMGRDIMALTKERDKYKADADRLAKVTRDLIGDAVRAYNNFSPDSIFDIDEGDRIAVRIQKARAELAAHEDLGGRA